MKLIRLLRSAAAPHPSAVRNSAPAFAILCLAMSVTAPTHATATEAANVMTPVAQAAQSLRADYRQQQWRRLARKSDRDSLIAAEFLGLPNAADKKPIQGHADVEQRLANTFGHDPLVLFTLALACQVQGESCAQPERYNALVRIAPDNAVHWLLLPSNTALNDSQLHAAATAKKADSHLRDVVRIVRAALANQPAPAAQTGVDPGELALLLRRNAVDALPLPSFADVISMCKAAVEPRRTDCIQLGRRLLNDRSGAILSRMIGSAILRRLVKGTPEDAAAKRLRRDYVWFSEQMEASTASYQEQLQEDVATFGEWEACLRTVERLGAGRTPPPEWTPKNPQHLLLPEERTPAASAK